MGQIEFREIPLSGRELATGTMSKRTSGSLASLSGPNQILVTRGYLTEPPPPELPTWERARWAEMVRTLAVGSRGEERIACRDTAAVLWDLWLPGGIGEIHFWRNGRRNHRYRDLPALGAGVASRRIRWHHGAPPLRKPATIHGILVTDLATTLLDCLRFGIQGSQRNGFVAATAAARKLVDASRWNEESGQAWCDEKEGLFELLRRSIDRRGKLQARRGLDWLDPMVESALEAKFLWSVMDGGFTRPTTQHRFCLPDGVEYYGDFWWPKQGVLTEVDGAVKYRANDAWETWWREKQRQDALMNSGLVSRILRVTAAEIEAPKVLLAILGGAGIV